ncbi:glycoside hydrolase family 2 protein [Cryobacterium lactosi]|uniref:Glycoside hydrolase family 2 protein n=1 Tax=Cryobacterium lactosi TaxID=1259202 RepID=A0A4R9BI09_9MICO|nr:glycoside hydrolase family 2 TIM barrel-domain containing protein [Cryobacterium lactosi]TFD83529.1 glycoside hydrolase family 2 protein [Cryobacterium lactosi]
MKAIDFNSGWSWRHFPAAPTDEVEPLTSVVLPHDAMLSEPRSPEASGGQNTGWFAGRDYEYVKSFYADTDFEDKVAILQFEGVYRKAEVWVNGQQVAYRPNGYTDFLVDITSALRIGQANEIVVIARNADQPNSRWYSGAGIYRPVTMWLGERQHILLGGIVVRTVSIDPPTVDVIVRSSGGGAVTINITDETSGTSLHRESGMSDGETRFRVELPTASLWNPGSPALYRCAAELAVDGRTDQADSTFGIRTLEWNERGFLVNGERIILQGACVHHDNGILGARAYADAEERKVRLLQENGYNAIRSAHNPCSDALLDACDRLGILVVDEYIDHWYTHKTRFDLAETFDEWWEQDLKDMVRKDRNHPSVIMYSIGNEVGETAEARGIDLADQMTRFLHALDDSRPVTCGVNIFFNYLSSIGLGVYSDQKSNRTPKKEKPVGSEFFNNMAGLLGANFMKWGATLRGSDLKTRDAFARLDIAGYNYGIRRYERDLKKYPNRLILGTETFCADAFHFRELAKAHPRLIGDFVWSGIDYLGETGIGAWEYRDYAPEFSGFGWLTAGSGRLDITGKALGEALYTRVALEQHAGPLIAVRPVNYTGQKHSPSAWKMSNAIESWSWNGCEGRRAQVEVYARAHRVELHLNGRRVASARLRDDCIARLECNWEPGILEAIAYDSSGRETGRHELRSAGEETELRVEPEQATVTRGGLSFIRVRYTDAQGTGKPQERGTLQVKVTGGTLLGLGSGAPYNRVGYAGELTDTYYGEALAVVQAADPGAKEIAVEVEDGTLRSRALISVMEAQDPIVMDSM